MLSRKGEKADMFAGGNDLQTVSDEIFGGSIEIPDSGRVVARPTPILSIHADPKQPRRTIPSSIRMHWDGNPLDVTPMLGQWHLVAEQAAGVTLDVIKLLNGEGEGLDSDKFPSVAQEYLSLLRLAQGIQTDGLINPITLIESDGKLLIESGERRWLAYHLLNIYVGDAWAKIPAAKGNTNDSVWRQATENTQRRQLNAIGMARQIGLLIMAARGTPPMAEGAPYREYEAIVAAGDCDRRYYAQVADGNVHRIPKGMGERIQSAMGLGMEQISQYRALLRLTTDEAVNDALWMRADVENWPEKTLRELRTLTVVKVSEVINRPQWTIDDLKALAEQPKPLDFPPPLTPPQRPVTGQWMNKRVRTKGNEVGTVIAVDGDLIKVLHDDGVTRRFYTFTDLTILAADARHTPAISPAPMPDAFFAIGDRVRTRTGSEGEVVSVSGRLIGVKTVNGTTAHDYSLLTKIGDAVPTALPFVVGERVVTKFGRVLTVQGYTHNNRLLMVNSVPNEAWWSIPLFDVKPYQEPVIDEDTIEPDGDPDEAAPARAWSEGVSIGGNNLPDEASSDKADSVMVTEPKRLFSLGSDAWLFLDALHDLAVLSDDKVTEITVFNLSEMTNTKAIELADQQILKAELDRAFDQIKNAMLSWQDVQIPAILQSILNAAQ